jgi:hypothetical protein
MKLWFHNLRKFGKKKSQPLKLERLVLKHILSVALMNQVAAWCFICFSDNRLRMILEVTFSVHGEINFSAIKNDRRY